MVNLWASSDKILVVYEWDEMTPLTLVCIATPSNILLGFTLYRLLDGSCSIYSFFIGWRYTVPPCFENHIILKNTVL